MSSHMKSPTGWPTAYSESTGTVAIIGDINNGVLYRKWFEHCDHQGADVVSRGHEHCCLDMPSNLAIVTSNVYFSESGGGGGDYGFDVWVAVDRTQEYIKSMKRHGYNLATEASKKSSESQL